MPTRVSSCEDWSISTALCLRPPQPTSEGSDVLGVGIDWAEEFHLVALGRPGDGVFDVARVEHNHAALRALGNRWLEVLWHCLTKDVKYNEAVHVANRNRALGKTTLQAA